MGGALSRCQGALDIVGVPPGHQGALQLLICQQGRDRGVEEYKMIGVGRRWV